MKFSDASSLSVIGQMNDEYNYHRLIWQYKGVVRDPVWEDSLSSAGISIRFRSNASILRVRWTLAEIGSLWNMNAAAVSGLDLNAHTDKGWEYVNTALAKDTANE